MSKLIKDILTIVFVNIIFVLIILSIMFFWDLSAGIKPNELHQWIWLGIVLFLVYSAILISSYFVFIGFSRIARHNRLFLLLNLCICLIILIYIILKGSISYGEALILAFSPMIPAYISNLMLNKIRE